MVAFLVSLTGAAPYDAAIAFGAKADIMEKASVMSA
jgi:hypothetical protein